MSLEKKITDDIKAAMLSKDSLKLEVCRSIKSAILLTKTEKASIDLDELKEIEILQKLLKQREDAYKIYHEQERNDLATHEQSQAKIIRSYLPTPYTIDELEGLIDSLMKNLSINSKQDMGRLISAVIKEAKGRANGRTVSDLIKNKLIS